MSIQTPGPGQWMDIAVQFTNDCGGIKSGHLFLRTVEQFADGSYCQGVILPRSGKPLAAYPNPADATLTLEQPAGTPLTVYNAQGRAMYHGNATAQPTPVDTRAWPEGLYFLHTRTGKTTERQQIQIKH